MKALGISGSFCVCGGETMFNQMSIVSLDQPNSSFNHTELALPAPLVPVGGEANANGNANGVPSFETAMMLASSSSGGGGGSSSKSSSRRRPQRGDLKSVSSVATMVHDPGHVLLELDDVRIFVDGGYRIYRIRELLSMRRFVAPTSDTNVLYYHHFLLFREPWYNIQPPRVALDSRS
jgi:hypothetical protein